MAGKTIPELSELDEEIQSTFMIPLDTGTQTFKATIEQLGEAFQGSPPFPNTANIFSGEFWTVPAEVTSIRVTPWIELTFDQQIQLVHTTSTAKVFVETNSGVTMGWGYGGVSVGDGTLDNRSSPVAVNGSLPIRGLTQGSTSVHLQTDEGYLVGWGGTGGVIGDCTLTAASIPTAVIGLSRASGRLTRRDLPTSRTFYLDEAGYLWGWGDNSAGALGDNTIVSKSSPNLVIGSLLFPLPFKEARTHFSGAMGLSPTGAAYAWGGNGNGYLGDGTILSKSVATAVVGGHLFSRILHGGLHALVSKADGSYWAWGANSNGELGDGTIISRSSPVAVIGSHQFTQAVSVRGMVLALKADGTAWAWGDNSNGVLGVGDIANRSSPVAVIGGIIFRKVFLGTSGSTNCMAGGIDRNGQVWTWGYGLDGQLGNGAILSTSSPVAVIGGHVFEDVIGMGLSLTMGRKANGSLWAWGSGNAGQLGTGNINSASSPVAVIGGYNFAPRRRTDEVSFVMSVTPGATLVWNASTNVFASNRIISADKFNRLRIEY